MTSRELILQLQEIDPSGDLAVMIPNPDPDAANGIPVISAWVMEWLMITPEIYLVTEGE